LRSRANCKFIRRTLRNYLVTFAAASLVTGKSYPTIAWRVLSLHVRISFCDTRRVRQQQDKVDPMRHPLTEEGGKHSFLIIRV
jgi:hypothetical protein